MEQIKKILAPTDLSELSKVGVRYALQLAKAIGAEVTVYHAVDYDTLTDTAKGRRPRHIFNRPMSIFWTDIKMRCPNS